MLATDNASVPERDGGGSNSAPVTAASDGSAEHQRLWQPLSLLPTEVMERIILYAMLPSHNQVPPVQSSDEQFCTQVRTHNALSLCLVSRRSDSLTRRQMYRKICIAHHRIPELLTSFRLNPTLAEHVREVRLDSNIFIEDIKQDVIAQLFKAVQKSCSKLFVGYLDSPMLPFLFAPSPHDSGAAALQVAHIVWRDDEPFEPERIRTDEQLFEQVMTIDTGETYGVDVRNTLESLFELEVPLSTTITPSPGVQIPRFPSRFCMYGNLQNLTLDISSQAQLDQLFLPTGYFVTSVLPLLTFLRIELPMCVLQCATAQRGALATHWPCTRFMFTTSDEADRATATLSQRLAGTRQTVVDRNQLAESLADGEHKNRVLVAPCVGELLRSLLTRFALNVQRNDTTMFDLLLGGSRYIHKPWSTRAAIAANVLAHSLERQLAFGSTDVTAAKPDKVWSSSHAATTAKQDNYIDFPLRQLEHEGGVGAYWQRRWQDADKEWKECQRTTLGDTYAGSGSSDGTPPDITVKLMLRWPAALENFFRICAMI